MRDERRGRLRVHVSVTCVTRLCLPFWATQSRRLRATGSTVNAPSKTSEKNPYCSRVSNRQAIGARIFFITFPYTIRTFFFLHYNDRLAMERRRGRKGKEKNLVIAKHDRSGRLCITNRSIERGQLTMKMRKR